MSTLNLNSLRDFFNRTENSAAHETLLRSTLTNTILGDNKSTPLPEAIPHFKKKYSSSFSAQVEEMLNAVMEPETSLLPWKEEILDLCEAILQKKFSENSDNSNTEPSQNGIAFRDLRGVKCPMNFVKTKLELSRLESGQQLKVYLDHGMPIENVPRSVRQEGHKVLEKERLGSYWSVLIEKGQEHG